MPCIFCDIVSGTVSVEMVAETSQYIAFPDREPQAPTHILIVPKAHIDGINAATRSDIELLGSLIFAAASVARQLKIDQEGYRLVINEGEESNYVEDYHYMELAIINTTSNDFDTYTIFDYNVLKRNNILIHENFRFGLR